MMYIYIIYDIYIYIYDVYIYNNNKYVYIYNMSIIRHYNYKDQRLVIPPNP